MTIMASDWADGGLDISLGECIYLPDFVSPLLTLDGKTYLKSGSLIVNDQATYPDAFNKFPISRPNNLANMLTTNDGPPVSMDQLIFANNMYMGYARGGSDTNKGQVFWSTNGRTWSTVTPGFTTIYGIGYINGRVVIAGVNSSFDMKLFASSTDFVTWTFWTDTNINPAYAFGAVGSYLVGIGAYDATYNPSNLMYSSNGTSWTRAASANLQFQAFRTLNVNGTLFTFGQMSGGGAYKVSYSTNGTTWTAHTALATILTNAQYFAVRDASWATVNGALIYVWCIDTKIYTSTTPTGTLTIRYTGSDYLQGSIFDGTKFIATGSEGTVISYDGISWTKVANYTAGQPVYKPYTNVIDPLVFFQINGSGRFAQRYAPVNAIGIPAHIEDGGCPLYMRIK